MTICIVDTSVFCNVLPVPGRDQDRQETIQRLEQHIADRVTLLLPLAAVFETGTHIAHLGNGGQRRKVAEHFVAQVTIALRGEAPWIATQTPTGDDMQRWLDSFPDCAMRRLSLADLSIIQEYERQCRIHRDRRVFIWSYDSDLMAYDRSATPR